MGILEKIGLKKQPKTKREGKPLETDKLITEGSTDQQAVPAVHLAGSVAHPEILIRPILSEKGTSLAGSGKYVFAVHPRANKPEIRKVIKQVYGVNVKAVQIIKLPGKLRRYGRTFGRTSDWKKAIVTVMPGEKIPGIIESVG